MQCGVGCTLPFTILNKIKKIKEKEKREGTRKEREVKGNKERKLIFLNIYRQNTPRHYIHDIII